MILSIFCLDIIFFTNNFLFFELSQGQFESLALSHLCYTLNSNNTLLQVLFQVEFRQVDGHFHFIGFWRFRHFSAVLKINVPSYNLNLL